MLGVPQFDTMIQLSSGRLLYPNRIFYDNQAHPDVNPDDTCAYGILQGERVRIECHYHRPEIDIASVSYSDDLGESWHMCDPLMGWFDAEGTPAPQS